MTYILKAFPSSQNLKRKTNFPIKCPENSENHFWYQLQSSFSDLLFWKFHWNETILSFIVLSQFLIRLKFFFQCFTNCKAFNFCALFFTFGHQIEFSSLAWMNHNRYFQWKFSSHQEEPISSIIWISGLFLIPNLFSVSLIPLLLDSQTSSTHTSIYLLLFLWLFFTFHFHFISFFLSLTFTLFACHHFKNPQRWNVFMRYWTRSYTGGPFTWQNVCMRRLCANRIGRKNRNWMVGPRKGTHIL